MSQEMLASRAVARNIARDEGIPAGNGAIAIPR